MDMATVIGLILGWSLSRSPWADFVHVPPMCIVQGMLCSVLIHFSLKQF